MVTGSGSEVAAAAPLTISFQVVGQPGPAEGLYYQC